MMTQPFVAPERAGRSAPPPASAASHQDASDVQPDFARILDDKPRQRREEPVRPVPTPPAQTALAASPLPQAPDVMSLLFAPQASRVTPESPLAPEQPVKSGEDEPRSVEDADALAFPPGGGAIMNFLARLAPPPLASGGESRPDASPRAPLPGGAVESEGGSRDARPLRDIPFEMRLAPIHRAAREPVAIVATALETHLEPVGVEPVYLQLAQRIDSALAPSLAEAGAPASAAPQLLPEASKAPLQVLRLQLQPADLGAVEVRLQLRAGEIHVRVAVESAEARLQLETGADKLGAALREKGYEVQSITITQDASPQDSPTRESGEQGRREGFGQRERSDRREHARGRNDRAGDEHERFAG